MGRTRKRKPYTKADSIRTRTRLMDDHEFMSDMEIKDRRRKIAAIMYMVNGNLIRQEKDEARRGYCPKCHCLMTPNGRCTSGCTDQAELDAFYKNRR